MTAFRRVTEITRRPHSPGDYTLKEKEIPDSPGLVAFQGSGFAVEEYPGRVFTASHVVANVKATAAATKVHAHEACQVYVTPLMAYGEIQHEDRNNPQKLALAGAQARSPSQMLAYTERITVFCHLIYLSGWIDVVSSSSSSSSERFCRCHDPDLSQTLPAKGSLDSLLLVTFPFLDGAGFTYVPPRVSVRRECEHRRSILERKPWADAATICGRLFSCVLQVYCNVTRGWWWWKICSSIFKITQIFKVLGLERQVESGSLGTDPSSPLFGTWQHSA